MTASRNRRGHAETPGSFRRARPAFHPIAPDRPPGRLGGVAPPRAQPRPQAPYRFAVSPGPVSLLDSSHSESIFHDVARVTLKITHPANIAFRRVSSM